MDEANEMDLRGTTAVVTGAGRRAVDVRNGEAVERAIRDGEADLGAVTLVVNNAGTGGPAGPWWEAGADEWWECVESIVRGSYNRTRAVLPGMLERGAGRVVGIVSTTGTGANPWADATPVAKSALIRHVENLAAGTAGKGVTAFALHPGIVKTSLLAGYRSSPAVAAMLDSIPEAAFVSAEIAAIAVGRICERKPGCVLRMLPRRDFARWIAVCADRAGQSEAPHLPAHLTDGDTTAAGMRFNHE